MPLYQVGCTGRTIWLSIDEILNMSKEDERSYVAGSIGEFINNPMTGSVMNDLLREKTNILNEEELELEESEEDEDNELFSNSDLEEMLSNDNFGEE